MYYTSLHSILPLRGTVGWAMKGAAHCLGSPPTRYYSVSPPTPRSDCLSFPCFPNLFHFQLTESKSLDSDKYFRFLNLRQQVLIVWKFKLSKHVSEPFKFLCSTSKNWKLHWILEHISLLFQNNSEWSFRIHIHKLNRTFQKYWFFLKRLVLSGAPEKQL